MLSPSVIPALAAIGAGTFSFVDSLLLRGVDAEGLAADLGWLMNLQVQAT